MANLESIPQCLRSLRQWLCWRYETRGDAKATKVPFAIAGHRASSTSPDDWCSFEEALAAAPRFDGIGFVFTSDDSICGIDLDNCLGPNGEITEWAAEISHRFGSYQEISPSGTGIKIWCLGKKPEGSRCQQKIDGGQIEFYSHGRFFTVTGDVWDDSSVTNQQPAIDWLVEKYLKQPAASAVRPQSPANFTLWQRGLSYVARAEPVAEGGRNSSAFRLAGNVAAIEGDNGERLSEDQVLLLVKQWNLGNSPPLADEELAQVVGSAMRNGTPRETKAPKSNQQEYNGVDLSGILSAAITLRDDSEGEDDDDFCRRMVPADGLLREIFDYYWTTAYKRTNVFGLAIAVSFCQTLFGRRITSHTDLRTNDYNVVIGPTVTGKEAVRKTVSKICDATGAELLFAAKQQSGNALLKEVAHKKCGLWLCDEFGKHLELILDKKSTNSHAKQIGDNLLDLYGCSNSFFSGASHADGLRNSCDQPHLCVLGLSTRAVFRTVSATQVDDGMLGRFAFWPVQRRPRRAEGTKPRPVPDLLVEQIKRWFKFEPGFVNAGLQAAPVVLEMEPEARDRWQQHADEIDERMDEESETRAAVWGRAAARAMKLALVHRAARFSGDPATLVESPIVVGIQDVDWAIELSNWLTNINCDLIKEFIPDPTAGQARQMILDAIRAHGEIAKSHFRKVRRFTPGDVASAARELQSAGEIEIEEVPTKGRPKTIYRMATNGN